MPLDVRKLIFSKKELRLALHSYAKDKGLDVADSHVESIQIVDGTQPHGVDDTRPDGLKVILNYTSHDPNNPKRVHLDQHQVVDALIGLCRSLHIPLPRRSQKFLQRHKDGGLALTVGMDEQDILLTRGAARNAAATQDAAKAQPSSV